jgi:hypothetical protein
MGKRIQGLAEVDDRIHVGNFAELLHNCDRAIARHSMKKNLILLISLLLCQIAFAQMKLEIVMVGNHFVECEPLQLNIGWQNISAQPLTIGTSRKPTYSKAVSLWINGEPRLVMPPPGYTVGTISVLAPRTLSPGETIADTMDLRLLELPTGPYSVKVIADFSKFPEGYFHGVVESNQITLTIDPATGDDLSAVKASQSDPEVIQSLARARTSPESAHSFLKTTRIFHMLRG